MAAKRHKKHKNKVSGLVISLYPEICFGFEYCNLEFICHLNFVICDLKNSILEKEERFINPTSVNNI